jgi:uncharacterized protein GlcG (DUF336 family)
MAHKLLMLAAAGSLATTVSAVAGVATCADLPDHTALRQALRDSVYDNGAFDSTGSVGSSNGGFDLNMWATIVDRDGRVCAVAFSGADRQSQWPGSRVISAQKASTANSFSLHDLALSTANLWAATQPSGSLYGLQHSNPVDTAVAYGDKANLHGDSATSRYGRANDPMVGAIVGGINVFGGGLALYDAEGTLLGAVGVSGDSSCADHNVAWRVRDTLGLDYTPTNDNVNYDLNADGVSASGFGHPQCGSGVAANNAGNVGICPSGDGTTAGCLDAPLPS